MATGHSPPAIYPYFQDRIPGLPEIPGKEIQRQGKYFG